MKLDVKDVSTLTKRVACSTAASVFDPNGEIEPFTIRAKMMMQQLWLMKIGWDADIQVHKRKLG